MFDQDKHLFTEDCIGYGFNQKAAKEVHEFIVEHLDVINDTPSVEDLMLWLETKFNLMEGEQS